MTTEINDTLERYTINGVGPYAFSFRIFASTDLTVTALEDGDVDPVTLSPSLYTVTGVNDQDGGSITLTAGAATTYDDFTLDIRSNVPVEQPSSIKNQGTFAPVIHETALDRLSRQIQDLARKVKQAFRYPDNVNLDAMMASRSSWLSRFLFVNSDGEIEPASGISSVAFTQSNIAAVLYPRTQAEIDASITPVDDSVPSSDATGVVYASRYCSAAMLTGAADATQALKNACLVVIELGSGAILDLGKHTYQVFPGTFTTTDIYGDLNRIGLFEDFESIELRDGECLFTCPGVFNTDNVRVSIFRFISCKNIKFVGARGILTGNRFSGGANLSSAVERRGPALYQFWQNSGDDPCVGVECLGQVFTKNFAMGVHFHSDVANAVIDGTRAVGKIRVRGEETGYPILTHRAGHDMDAEIDSLNCGRSCTLQDILRWKVKVNSVNFTASVDVGFSGDLDDYSLEYHNTRSTGVYDYATQVTTPGELGYCVGFAYPVLADSPNRVARNGKVKLNIECSGATFFTRMYNQGLAPGVSSAAIDTAFIIDNYEVSGRLVDDGTSSQLFIVTDPSAWSTGANMRNIRYRDLIIKGGGSVSIDLNGLIDEAVLENIISESDMQLNGNTTALINCTNVTAPDIVLAANTSRVNFENCSNTNGPLLSFINKQVCSLVFGAIKPVEQWFTFYLINDGGTLKHATVGTLSGGSPSFAAQITGATSTETATPTGADGSTAMAAGCKISSAATNTIVFNTSDQTSAALAVSRQHSVIARNDSGTALMVDTDIVSRDVNGVTRYRLELSFRNAGTGAAFDLTALASGKIIVIKYHGFLV